jgi:hypothetical protein
LTFESLERIRLFVGGNRRKTLIAAQNARLNGYKTIAAELENETRLAELILKDLASEHGDSHAIQKADF